MRSCVSSRDLDMSSHIEIARAHARSHSRLLTLHTSIGSWRVKYVDRHSARVCPLATNSRRMVTSGARGHTYLPSLVTLSVTHRCLLSTASRQQACRSSSALTLTAALLDFCAAGRLRYLINRANSLLLVYCTVCESYCMVSPLVPNSSLRGPFPFPVPVPFPFPFPFPYPTLPSSPREPWEGMLAQGYGHRVKGGHPTTLP